MASWDDVRRIALALPETEERPAYGNPAWRVPEGPILGARVEHLIAKEALLADNPDVYFTTPHFDGHASVLIRLDRIKLPELEEAIAEAWMARAPKRLLDG